MRTSTIYLGANPSYEPEVRKRIQKDLGRLHVDAQRVAWGVLMGERLGIDLDEPVERLLSHYGDEPAARVAVAIARACQGRSDEVSDHLVHARKAAGPEHPWALLVPSEDSLQRPRPEPEVLEEIPGRVYRVVGGKDLPGIPFGNVSVASFVRMRSGELVCINPVALGDDHAEKIRGLGEVTHIVAPAKYHSEGIPRAQELFPRARTWGVPGQQGYPGVSHIRFDGYLDDDAPLFPDELDQITMHGVDVGDVWLVDRASRTLLVTDCVFFTEPLPGWERYTSAFSAFYGWAWGVYDRVGIPSYQPLMWKDIRAYQASIRRALTHDFDHVASSHGPWSCTRGNGKEDLRRSVEWLLELDRLDALRLVGDFVLRHPKIFLRFLQEQLAAR